MTCEHQYASIVDMQAAVPYNNVVIRLSGSSVCFLLSSRDKEEERRKRDQRFANEIVAPTKLVETNSETRNQRQKDDDVGTSGRGSEETRHDRSHCCRVETRKRSKEKDQRFVNERFPRNRIPAHHTSETTNDPE